MSAQGRVHFVGSIPGEDAEEVFTKCCAAVGDHLARIPDGETGDRLMYICHLAEKVYAANADVETMDRPLPVDPSDPDEWRRPDQHWVPRLTNGGDNWKFQRRKGVRRLHFDTLGYAEAAIASYEVFCRVRDRGEIPKGVRFQVSLPAVIDAVAFFMYRFTEFPHFASAYDRAMAADIRRMLDAIPAEDLAIQWDCVGMTLQYDTKLTGRKLDLPVKIPWIAKLLMGNPLRGFGKALAKFAAHVPEQVELGIHLCYGDIGRRHALEPLDLAPCVGLANRAVKSAGRRIDWVHMPVPRDRTDEGYFAPLRELDPSFRLFLGLVHLTDGIEGTKTRIEAARRYHEDFGVATECGFGRRSAETIPDLLALHDEAAASL